MKKIIHLMLSLLLCMAMALPAFADTFVPSVGEKPAPDVEDAVMGEEEERVTPCIVVTTIDEAQEKSTDIHQEARDELLMVYEKLSDGTMKVPTPEGYVIRDLVDISFLKGDCIEDGDGHDEWLSQENTAIFVDFKLSVSEKDGLIVLVFVNGEWCAVPVIINDDGTVTCEFHDFGPVAFCVKGQTQPPAPTGDTIVRDLALWVVLIAVSAAAMVALVVYRRKSAN